VAPADRDAVGLLRRAGNRVVYAVNKIDTPKHDDLVHDFSRLGVEPLVAVSAEHAHGIEALMDAVRAALPDVASGRADAPAPAGTRLALVGRPNVGKSSLLNRLAGYERSIVSATPGTTRDPIDMPVVWGRRPYVVIDTGGVRRRTRLAGDVERLTALRALRALERAEIALLVLDAVEGMTDQDARLAGYAWERGRGLAFLVNKWDLLPARRSDERAWLDDLHARFPAFAAIPALGVSARTGWQVERIPALVAAIERAFAAELPTVRVNQVLQTAVRGHAPPTVRGKAPRFFYATQVGTRPPEIVVFTSDPDRVRPSYARYLQGRFAETYGLRGTPLRLRFRRRR
jgi:GTP-binding protein